MEENTLSFEEKQTEYQSTVFQERGGKGFWGTTSGFLRVRWLRQQLFVAGVNGVCLLVEDPTQASLKLAVLSHLVLVQAPYYLLCNFASPLVPGVDPNCSLGSAFSCANVVVFQFRFLTADYLH